MIGHWHPESLAIDASAGYGKTETLGMRLLAMLLSDPGLPRRAAALTFSRAAAGEIYERLLLLLCAGLRGGDGLERLRDKFRRQLGTEAFSRVTAEELLELLKLLIREMGSLNISTIDSFFYRLVRVFAVELGLPGTVELEYDGGEGAAAAELLRELLSVSTPGGEIISSIRESRYGEERKSYFDTCCELLLSVQEFRSRRNEPEFWGGRFRNFAAPSPDRLAAALEQCEQWPWTTDKYGEKLGPLLRSCAAARTPEYRFDRTEQKTLRTFLKVWHDFPRVKPDGFQRGWDFPEPVASALRLLIGNGRNVLLCQCAQRTAALGRLVAGYCRLEEPRMLRRGRLRFSDRPRLLLAPPAASGFLDDVQYRTNCRFLHFLIDEFQDTSREQWRVLEPMTGDHGEGDHSLFLVGDVKQAIYGWRSGDSRLMGEVSRNLEKRRLGRSFRYGPEICSALSLLFGGVACCPALPAAAPTLWREAVAPHVPDPGATAPGEFEVLALAPPPHSGAGKEDFASAVARLIIDRLRQVDFFSRGLTGGVLVRNRRHGIALRDALLAEAPEYMDSIIWEGDEGIAGDPLVASLLAFGVGIQHPADTMAAETVRMNQLLHELFPETEEARLEWLTLIAERGVAAFLRGVLSRINTRGIAWNAPPAAEWRPLENGSVDALLALAERFDASGARRDLLKFREAASRFRRPAAAAPGKLRLLTIHHSKGLTFDVVFHPLFDTPAHGNWRSPDASEVITGGGSPGSPAWMLYRPREEGMSVPEIAAAVEAAHADSCFEELCTLYVALTRARRGMYVFLPPPGKGKCAVYHPQWSGSEKFRGRRAFSQLEKASYGVLDLVFETFFSDPELFPPDSPLPVESRAGIAFIRRGFGVAWRQERIPAHRPGPLRPAFKPAAERLLRATPSRLAGERRLYFQLPRRDGGELLGLRVHAFFERIGFWNEFTPPPDTGEAVLEHYRACAENPEVVRLLNEHGELWRERPFDVVLRDASGVGALVSGCFDRVQIRRGAGGGVERACIVDYKSNAVTPEELAQLREHYRPQLETYRRALAVLLGITPNLIECRLLFTRLGALESV